MRPRPNWRLKSGFSLSIESAVPTTVLAAVPERRPNETSSATEPVTIGALNDVPEALAQRPPGKVETTPCPGAVTVTCLP